MAGLYTQHGLTDLEDFPQVRELRILPLLYSRILRASTVLTRTSFLPGLLIHKDEAEGEEEGEENRDEADGTRSRQIEICHQQSTRTGAVQHPPVHDPDPGAHKKTLD